MTTKVVCSPVSPSIQQWLSRAAGHITADGDSVLLDLRVLLAHQINQTSSWVLAHPEFIIPPQALSRLEADFDRYQMGTPLPYLTGEVEFFGHAFKVSPDVLIPRPETELLVDKALSWLQHHPQHYMLDVGTGTACIPISIALAETSVRCLAVDISYPALQVAQMNRANHHLEDRIDLVCSNLAAGLDLSHFHLITANLPYIPRLDLSGLSVARHEPTLALDGGEDGLRLIELLLARCSKSLTRPYCIFLEIEYRQADSVKEIAMRYFESDIIIHFDLAGLPRLAEIRGD